MPYADAETRARRKAEVLARVEAGETLDAVCRAPGLPGRPTVRAWRRADPLFAAALRQAQLRGRWRRMCAFDEAKAEVLLARIRAGERLTEILKDPAMPNRHTYNQWRAAQAPFCAEIERLKAAAQAQRNRDVRARVKVVFDPVVADRIVARVMRGAWLTEVLAADPALPSKGVVNRWRRERPDFDRLLRQAMAAVKSRRTLSRRRREAVEDFVVERIAAGETLVALAARADLPNRDTLYRWMRQQPAFAARIAEAREAHRRQRTRGARRRSIMYAARRRMAEVTRRGRRPGEEA